MKLLPIAKAEALGLGVGRRTIGRLIADQNSGFPKPVRINGRLYVLDTEVAAYRQSVIDRALAARDSAQS